MHVACIMSQRSRDKHIHSVIQTIHNLSLCLLFVHGIVKESIDTSGFAYLCPNGSLQAITPDTVPCVWLRQPWPLIISNSYRSVELSQRLNGWLQNTGSSNWQTALREIINADNLVVVDTTIQSPRDAMRPCKSCIHSLVC